MTQIEEFTHPSVYEGIAARAPWADPTMNPTEITDWPERQARALIPFRVVNGRPLNPMEPNLRPGRNECGHWGEQACADAIVRANGRLLMVERKDGHGWALPGGYQERGETPEQCARRELQEETGLVLPAGIKGVSMGPRYGSDPRASREAWYATEPFGFDLGIVETLPEVIAGDDAKQAEWIPASAYMDLWLDLSGNVFRAHWRLLHEILG